MEGLDFFKQFSSPAPESLAKDNIMIFTVHYVLQYISGTRYLPGTGTSTPNFQCTPSPAPPHNDGAMCCVQPPKRIFWLRAPLDLPFLLSSMI